jgi:hypothetical protein
VILLLVYGFAGAIDDTDWFFAMIAWNPLEMNTHIGKATFLIFIDSQVFKGSWRESVPILTSHGTGMAARASALVKEETILRHYEPFDFSTWTSPLQGRKPTIVRGRSSLWTKRLGATPLSIPSGINWFLS